jgi:hypothetical protein
MRSRIRSIASTGNKFHTFFKSMDYQPSLREVQTFVDDFREDFGVSIPLRDAERILMLYEELATLFEEYSEGDMPLWQFFER